MPAAEHIPHWRNLSPRVGAAYDLFGDGRTAIKGSLGMYPDIIRVSPANPANLFSLTTNRTWNDTSFGAGDPRSGNFRPDCELLNPVANGECGRGPIRISGGRRLSTRNAPDSLEGFNEQFRNWQASVNFQHELTQGLALNVGYFRTWYGGFLATDNEAVSGAANFDSLLHHRADRFPAAGRRRESDLRPVRRQAGVVRPRRQPGDAGVELRRQQTQVFNGFDLTLNGRFGQGGQFSGGLSVGRTVTDNCFLNDNPSVTTAAFLNVLALPATSTVPRNSEFCHVAPPWSSGTQLKFLAVYPLPWDFETSAIFQNSPGIPITASYVVDQRAGARDARPEPGGVPKPDGGHVHADGPHGAHTAEHGVRAAADAGRSASVAAVPARADDAPAGHLDIYNVFNASSVLSMTPTYGAAWQNVAYALSARLLRIGAQLDF